MEFGKNFVIKMWKWLTKWKLVDTTKYDLVNTKYFVLSENQTEKVAQLFEEYGGMDYCFYPLDNNWGFKVKIWKKNEWIDLTESYGGV